MTSLRYFFSFFSHFLEALTICFDVIFMLMSSSWRETRWPMVLLCRARRLAWEMSALRETRLAAVRLAGFCEVRLDWLERSGRACSPGPAVVARRNRRIFFAKFSKSSETREIIEAENKDKFCVGEVCLRDKTSGDTGGEASSQISKPCHLGWHALLAAYVDAKIASIRCN